MWGQQQRFLNLLFQSTFTTFSYHVQEVDFYPNLKFGLNGKELVFSTKPYAYQVVHHNDVIKPQWTGYLIDVIDFCAMELNFR